MPLRPLALVVLALGVLLLIIGFAVGSDVLGLLFMVCVVAALGVFAADLALRRRKSA
jgi:hypothetical protein